MVGRLQKHVNFIKKLLSASLKEGRRIICQASISQTQVLGEIIHNILHNVLKIPEEKLKALHRWRKTFRYIGKKSIAAYKKIEKIKSRPLVIIKLLQSVRDQLLSFLQN
jgi:uncharacterized protein YfeS